jgi:hypothetical protein
MSSTIALLILATLLGGCAAYPPAPAGVKNSTTLKLVETCSLQHWLGLQEEVAEMTVEEVVARLGETDPAAGTAELFYFGLLNQQLQEYEAWIQARDTFRQVRETDGLTIEQRQLAGLLESYNQRRINWYQRHSELQAQNSTLERQLREAEQEKALLQQKIQALTDLEADMSDRKEP